ncbi:MAG TPA: LLM class flavin-dependent oxidoreductase [Candidatus Binataceae bacterium]|nr:LLM class flavin-dependent oxidoreductase [Candidatus Binataceae bacterium]
MKGTLPLENRLRFGAIVALWDRDQAISAAASIGKWGYEAIWTGDHVAFTVPISDPLTQLTYLSALNPKLTYGTCVYLLPLRHPVPVAKMVATADRLMGAGHFIFGVGVGGEFPREYEACGVPIRERGGRATEAIGVLKQLWTGQRVEHRGKYFSFSEIAMQPAPATPGGPPVWVGGRKEAALKRAARCGDGWMPYVITPQRYGEGLDFIAREAERAGRRFERFGTGLLLFCALGPTYEEAHKAATEHLSLRYGMDFSEPARRYCALGRPADVAEKISELIRAGVRDFAIDCVCRFHERDAQMEQFAREVIPLVRL